MKARWSFSGARLRISTVFASYVSKALESAPTAGIKTMSFLFRSTLLLAFATWISYAQAQMIGGRPYMGWTTWSMQDRFQHHPATV